MLDQFIVAIPAKKETTTHAWAGFKSSLQCCDFNSHELWKCLLAEFIGTLFLVFSGCAACSEGWNESYSPTMVQVALCFGITVATMVQAIGHISKCHINPAVTTSMMLVGKIMVLKGLAYVIAQCTGGIAGVAVLKILTPPEFRSTLGVTELHNKVTSSQGFGIEFFATFVLVLIICSVCDENRTDVGVLAPLAIGLTVSSQVLAIGMYTGGSMNPARSLGPAVLLNKWSCHWVYWVGPVIGGGVAALVYQRAFAAPSK